LDYPMLSLQDAIGSKLTKDIVNNRGVLLVPASTIIGREHIRILELHEIELTHSDITSIGPYANMEHDHNTNIINEAVLEVGHLFEEVRETRQISLSNFRKNVIPIIQDAATQGNPLFTLFASLQSKDDYTYRHNVAVGAISNLIGNWMGLERNELLQLTTAALLHDVGKMLIPSEILIKPEKLTPEEFSVMKSHTVLGYELLKKTVGVTHRQALVALQHHERMDGSGYPFGIKKEKIDLFSRIVSVADVFHAMTSKRTYRDPSPFYEVLFQIRNDAFGILDPAITKLFIEKIMNSLIGHSVELTDGSEGIILMINANEPIRPLIRISDRYLDLSKELQIHIKQIH